MCGETRDRVGFGPLPQGPRNSDVHENMMLPKLDTFFCLQVKGLAWIRGMDTRARPSMEMMACARGLRTELQVMISEL